MWIIILVKICMKLLTLNKYTTVEGSNFQNVGLGNLKLDHEPISNSPTKVRYIEHFPIVSKYITQQNEAIHENDV